VEQNNPPLLLEHPADTQFLQSLFVRGCNEVNPMDEVSEDSIRAILDLILHTCKKLYPKDTISIQQTRGHLLVKNLLRLVEENYQRNLSINEYAGMLSITPNHLTQLVKQVTGNTSAKLIQNKVIIETKRLLIHTEMTVTEIADFMNFTDQSYFTKFFKKACGVTPLQYRKAKR
jgi:AraC-like DNA-binding protein